MVEISILSFMKRGYEYEDWDPPAREKVRKPLRRKDPEFPTKRFTPRTHPLPTPTAVIAPDHNPDPNSLLSLAASLPHYQRQLLEMFILHRGPQQVFRYVSHTLEKSPFRPTSLPRDREIMRLSTGETFRRWFQYWLSDQKSDIDTVVLGKGACNPLFEAIRKVIYNDRKYTPDVAVFTNLTLTPTLSTIYETVLSPEAPNSQTNLEGELSLISRLNKSITGRTLNFPSLDVDRERGLRFNTITIPNEPKITVVIPGGNQRPAYIPEDVSVLPTPFSKDLVSEVAFRSVRSLLPVFRI